MNIFNALESYHLNHLPLNSLEGVWDMTQAL